MLGQGSSAANGAEGWMQQQTGTQGTRNHTAQHYKGAHHSSQGVQGTALLQPGRSSPTWGRSEELGCGSAAHSTLSQAKPTRVRDLRRVIIVLPRVVKPICLLVPAGKGWKPLLVGAPCSSGDASRAPCVALPSILPSDIL